MNGLTRFNHNHSLCSLYRRLRSGSQFRTTQSPRTWTSGSSACTPKHLSRLHSSKVALHRRSSQLGVSSSTGSSDLREVISRESPLPWMRKFAWLWLLTHHALWQHSSVAIATWFWSTWSLRNYRDWESPELRYVKLLFFRKCNDITDSFGPDFAFLWPPECLMSKRNIIQNLTPFWRYALACF